MRSKIKLLTLLALLSVGLYLGFASLLTTDCDLLNHCTRFMVRIITCCTALVHYLHLQGKQRITHSIPSCAHVYRLIISTLLVQLLMTFALTLFSSIKESLGHPSVQPVLHFSSSIDFVCHGIIEVSCLAAILEELLFRGIVEKLLSKRIPSRLWVTTISSLAFSLMHCNISNSLLYFVMGCFLSYLYHQTKHIIYPIIAHGLHNLWATSITYLALETRLALTIGSFTIVTRTILAIGSLLAVYGVTHVLTKKII